LGGSRSEASRRKCNYSRSFAKEEQVFKESGGLPVIILTKADLCNEKPEIKYRVMEIAAGISVYAVSAVTGEGLDDIGQYIACGKTMVFIGSLGVGKSTLLNRLAGREIMHVNSIREDDSKGRHTTAHRQLVLLPSGCMCAW